ncbi:protein mono-ADP-ribosyltransferase PARP14-like isoform X3 [Hoplias malabaricus]|uniref:protein mono-ADP-ribosyltransferase PARP14-like isoform X3 n=1 Tax=Hoplias malabaricus TaxID=27720 RepID=UPI0034621707
MAEKTLLLEGLPEDFNSVKSKLELYFKNKRRSGGEILHIKQHPEDKRKALLVYLNEADVKKVLEKRIHRIDFKAQGAVQLTVRLLEDQGPAEKNIKPHVLPKEKLDDLDQNQSAQATASERNKFDSEIHKEDLDLLVSTTESDKETLTMYFEQFTEHAQLTKHGKNSWILKVATQSDVEKILQQKEHEFGLSVEVYKERSSSEIWDPCRFILTGFKDTCKYKLITVFIGSCSQKAEHTWELVDDDRIVVTFKEVIDANTFVKKVTSKKMKDMEIGVSRLELTGSVLVQGNMSKITEELLNLYFSNKRSGGGDITSIIWVSKSKSVVITFDDSHVAHRVVEKKHHISDTQLSTSLFYPSLQKILTGKTPTLSNISTEITMPVDVDVLGFIERNVQCKRDLLSQLKKVHADVIFEKTESPKQIKLEMAVDKDSLAALRIGPTWESKAKREANAFLSKYSKAEQTIENELWKRVEKDCYQLTSSDISLSIEEAKSRIVIVGIKEAVDTLINKLKQLLEDAMAELEVERNTVDKVIRFESKEMLELVANCVHSKLSNEIYTKDEGTLSFHLKGFRENVNAAEKVIKQAQENVTLQNLSLSSHLVQFLKSLDLKKFEQDHFFASNIQAFFMKNGDHLGVLAETENIKKAEDKLADIIRVEIIQITPELTPVINSETWVNFLKAHNANVELTHDVIIIPSEGEIVICGFAQMVADLLQKVNDYLENKTPATEDIHFQSLQEVEFIESCMNLSAVPEIRNLDLTILAGTTESPPCLKVTGAKEKIQDAVSLLKKHVSAIITETFAYSKAGETKVIQKHEANVKAKAKEFNCKAYLSTKVEVKTDLTVTTSAHSTNTTSKTLLSPLKHKKASDTEETHTVTVHGVQVSLKKGDITKETVDVIVNSSNKTLDLDTGVSGAILAAAGTSVVDECKKLGPQKADGVVLTSGGNLSCKHIAQIVGPVTAVDITASIEKVLSLCESKNATTVAIPAIGTGKGGIGASESIKAIFIGLENHLTQSQSSCLKEIFAVAFEQKIFDSYCIYFKERKKLSPKVTKSMMPANQVKISGVRIEVKKGSITNETVRGIVNTTNNKMNLMGGVSGAIFRAAGPSVQQECQTLGPLQSDTAAVTSGGNLQCDYIIHMMGPHSAADARLRVKKVLERCEEKQISTVSFPAVGTGGGGLKSAESIDAMLEGIEDHLSQLTSTAIKLIYVVIDRDEVLQEFLEGLKQWTTKCQVEEEEEVEDEGEEEEGYDEEDEEEEGYDEEDEEEDKSANTTEALIGQIKVKVLCGDITKETTEAIVSSTNTSLDLSSGVSGAILKAAGQTVVEDCKKLGPQPSDGVVLTTAGNLALKNIIHMVGQTSEKEITRCMHKVLKKCEENKIQSVSFPALGTGAGNLAADQVAQAMIKAVEMFSKDSPAFLKQINIVIFQPKMLSNFEEVLKSSKKISPKSRPTSVPKPGSIKQTQTLSPLCFATKITSVTFPIMNVEVYGTSTTDLAKVKAFLDDLISEECASQDIESSHLPSLPEADKESIVALSKNNQVHVHVLAADKWTVSGKKDDVLDAVLKINKFLQAAKDRELQKEEEKRLSETLRWEVARGEAWAPLDVSISYQMERAFYNKEQTFSYQAKGENYTVDFKDLKRVNSKGESCRVKRTLLGDSETAIIHPPTTWTNMGGKDLEIITLLPSSNEYKKIQNHFILTSKHKDVSPVQVVEIHRIQNQQQWQRYCVLKQAVDKKYPTQRNDQILYHGTTKEICQKINKNGFNRSFCGRNAVVHGDGTYFAKEAWYSCQDQYSNQDENGLKYIYRARVVTGKPCKSKKGMKEPDPLDPNDPQAGLHDCAVDDLQNPFIFVVFCDAGAYPDYLITFKNV